MHIPTVMHFRWADIADDPVKTVDLEEVAQARGLSLRTIKKHIREAVDAGHIEICLAD